MMTTMFKKWKEERKAKELKRAAERKAKKLKRAAELVRDAGFAICELKTISGTTYIKHNNGNWMRVGRAA